MKYMATIFAVCFAVTCFGQVPQSFNYQAVVRDASNNPVTNDMVDFRIAILQDETEVYAEDHNNKLTGELGIVNLKIGDGANPTSDFSMIDWSNGSFQIEVFLDGNNESIGRTDIVAVPFALYAQNAGRDEDWNYGGDSILYTLDKKVGVGTVDPGIFMFSVVGPSSVGAGGNGNVLLNLNSERGWQFRQFSEGAVAALELVSIGGGGNKNFLITTGGKVGINTLEPKYKLHVNGSGSFGPGENSQDGSILLKLDSERAWFFRQLGSGANTKLELLSSGGGGNKDFLISTGGNVGIGTTDPQEKLDVNGRTRTKTLEITGGSDINEDFNSIDQLEPGDVVVIDEANPGQIRRTNAPYDQKVAGIISGANGINPGISLSQQDVLEGDFPLAMVGRVYVKVTGEVKVGDMLTTSEIPGYAMAAIDFNKSNGTVIGKAMTANESGMGMVLVLVNLQ